MSEIAFYCEGVAGTIAASLRYPSDWQSRSDGGLGADGDGSTLLCNGRRYDLYKGTDVENSPLLYVNTSDGKFTFYPNSSGYVLITSDDKFNEFDGYPAFETAVRNKYSQAEPTTHRGALWAAHIAFGGGKIEDKTKWQMPDIAPPGYPPVSTSGEKWDGSSFAFSLNAELYTPVDTSDDGELSWYSKVPLYATAGFTGLIGKSPGEDYMGENDESGAMSVYNLGILGLGFSAQRFVQNTLGLWPNMPIELKVAASFLGIRWYENNLNVPGRAPAKTTASTDFSHIVNTPNIEATAEYTLPWKLLGKDIAVGPKYLGMWVNDVEGGPHAGPNIPYAFLLSIGLHASDAEEFKPAEVAIAAARPHEVVAVAAPPPPVVEEQPPAVAPPPPAKMVKIPALPTYTAEAEMMFASKSATLKTTDPIRQNAEVIKEFHRTWAELDLGGGIKVKIGVDGHSDSQGTTKPPLSNYPCEPDKKGQLDLPNRELSQCRAAVYDKTLRTELGSWTEKPADFELEFVTSQGLGEDAPLGYKCLNSKCDASVIKGEPVVILGIDPKKGVEPKKPFYDRDGNPVCKTNSKKGNKVCYRAAPDGYAKVEVKTKAGTEYWLEALGRSRRMESGAEIVAPAQLTTPEVYPAMTEDRHLKYLAIEPRDLNSIPKFLGAFRDVFQKKKDGEEITIIITSPSSGEDVELDKAAKRLGLVMLLNLSKALMAGVSTDAVVSQDAQYKREGVIFAVVPKGAFNPDEEERKSWLKLANGEQQTAAR